jgi:hypothetical protein
MTPFERKGWTKDDSFEVYIYSKYVDVALHTDDGSNCPLFVDKFGTTMYLGLNEIRKITEGETKCSEC